jgi:hypothetical protein
MSTTDDNIKVAGVTLSALFREVLCCNSDAEGLLFGSINKKEQQKFDDYAGSKQFKTTIAIQSYVPLGALNSFYDATGIVDPNLLAQILSSRKQSFLGWFRFRRGLPLKPSLKELAVHKQLEALYLRQFGSDIPKSPRSLESAVPPLLFLVLSQGVTEDQTVHSFDYRALKVNSLGEVSPVALEVVNLISSSQEEYLNFNPISTYDKNIVGAGPFSELSDALHTIPGMLETPPALQQTTQ